MRQSPNLRIFARGLPQIAQRLCCCVGNFGGRFDLAIFDFFATVSVYLLFPVGTRTGRSLFLKGLMAGDY